MDWKFDHLVHFTFKPEEAKTEFNKEGFQAFDGGRHENWGTYNTLCYFQNLRYIEWIGFFDMNLAKSSENPLIRQITKDAGKADGEGFSQIALRTANMNETKQRIEQKGLKTIGPIPGSRRKESGEIIHWSMLFIEEKNEDECRYPFFIQWGESDQQRSKQFEKFVTHSGKKPTLSAIGFSAANPQKTAKKFLRLLDMNKNDLIFGKDQFGKYISLLIGGVEGVELRFYEGASKYSPLVQNRPFLCEITGTDFEKTITLNNGIYHIRKS